MCEILDEVKEEGKNEGKIELLVDLVKTGVLSISEAAKKLKCQKKSSKNISNLNTTIQYSKNQSRGDLSSLFFICEKYFG